MNEKTKFPTKLDWVRERAKCFPIQIFRELRTSVQDDVEAINAERTLQAPFAFMLTDNSTGTFFTVYRQTAFGSSAVSFHVTKTGIAIKKNGGVEIVSTLSLNNEGRCVLRVGDDELEPWQFRRLALEELFFLGDDNL